MIALIAIAEHRRDIARPAHADGAPAVARMRPPPRLNPGHRLRPPVIVPVLRLRQPLGLARTLARRLAGRRRAVALMMRVARVRDEPLGTMPTRPLLCSAHLAPRAASPTRLPHKRGRTPKKSQTAKKTPACNEYPGKKSGASGASFTSADSDRFQVGRDTMRSNRCRAGAGPPASDIPPAIHGSAGTTPACAPRSNEASTGTRDAFDGEACPAGAGHGRVHQGRSGAHLIASPIL